jgi:DNA-binding CsgD family transcriptional regulator
MASLPFVGRCAELERLRVLLPRAQGEDLRMALLSGEAGAGKSRLVREFAAEAAASGALVLYGACDAVVRTPYGAFAEALGELRSLLPGSDALDPDTERHRLHTAVVGLLARATAERPALLVLEDLHWADAATLLLLRHLARVRGARVLVLATFRDTEAEVPEALAETLADLRRYDVMRLRLAGLSDAEVAEFVRRAGGSAPSALARTIRSLTEGNAFLVCEMWRALLETGAMRLTGGEIQVRRPPETLGSPEGVREVVSRRLTRLSPLTVELLELGATAGTAFELDVVRHASEREVAELLPALEEAVSSGMIDEVASRGLAWRFDHELVRRALYDRLSRPRRAELHLRVGEALEACDTEPGRWLADLAHHFAAAAPFGDSERAVEYNVRAARAARDALAFEDAAAHLRTALSFGERRPELLIELGQAEHRAGRAPEALEAFRQAAATAREQGDAAAFARAAIGHEEACWRPAMLDHGAVELLEEAAQALGDEDSELRVGLLSGLARACDLQGRHERADVTRASAIAMARRLGDDAGLATCLMRSYWARGAGSRATRLQRLTEAMELGERLGRTEIHAEAMSWRVPAMVDRCDLASARRAIPVLRETAERTAQPFMLHVAEHFASALALCDGRLELAERHAHRSHEWGRLLTGRDSSGVFGIQMFGVQRERGRLAELAPVVRILAGDPNRDGAWRPSLIVLLTELGMEAEARRELARVAADGLDPLRPTLWIASLAYLADACSALGDEAIAALVYPELKPLAGGNVMVGHMVACYGAADRYLGMLAATLGEDDDAVGHFERALELNREMGAVTWYAHTAYEYGRFLRSRRREGADRLLAEAADLAQRIGLPRLVGRIRELGMSELPDGLSPREAQVLDLVARGLSNRRLGATLSISEHTAANHVRSILRKTGCANRTEAASYAHQHGIARAG